MDAERPVQHPSHGSRELVPEANSCIGSQRCLDLEVPQDKGRAVHLGAYVNLGVGIEPVHVLHKHRGVVVEEEFIRND